MAQCLVKHEQLQHKAGTEQSTENYNPPAAAAADILKPTPPLLDATYQNKRQATYVIVPSARSKGRRILLVTSSGV
jgi:hypothetical protein